MTDRNKKGPIRCAIYTRKSSEEGLEQEFNSLDAQREAAEAFIASQKSEGWACLPSRYDDGGFTGGNMDRPALERLLRDIESERVDCVVVYKVDRLSRSLLDFARMMETFEKFRVSFVSVTQQFNTTHSMGRLTLNILLSFAQFEREIISERTRDKIAATRRKGKWSGGRPLLGYDVDPDAFKLVVNQKEAERVKHIFDRYIELQSIGDVVKELNGSGWTTKSVKTKRGKALGGHRFSKNRVRAILTNVQYMGKVRYKKEVHPGEHAEIVTEEVWRQAQAIMQANGRSGGMHIKNKYGALLKGILYCGPCQRSMIHSYTVRKSKLCYRYYVCGTAAREGWQACPSKSIPAAEVERFVIDQIRQIGKSERLMQAVVRQTQAQVTEDGVRVAMAAFGPIWNRLAPKEQARALQLLIKRVDYDGANGSIAITFHPDGIATAPSQLEIPA